MVIPKTNVPLSEQHAFHQHLEESRWPHPHTSQSARIKTQSSEARDQPNHRSQSASSNCDSGLKHGVAGQPEVTATTAASQRFRWAWFHRRWQGGTAASTNDCQPSSLSWLLHSLINVSSHSLRVRLRSPNLEIKAAASAIQVCPVWSYKTSARPGELHQIKSVV